MANHVENILTYIIQSIPREILEVAFNSYKRNLTIDECILRDVIYTRVLPDCNLAGRYTQIHLIPEWIIDAYIPNYYGVNSTYCIYRIPPEAREYRNIADVISISYSTIPSRGLGTNNSFYPYAGVGVGSVADQMLNGHTLSNTRPMPVPVLQDGNIVKLTPVEINTYQINWMLTCMLEFDKDFTNLHKKSLMTLRDLCLIAVKNYIYNKLIIQVDRAYIEGGQELGMFKTVLDSYASDATNERYNELLKRFNGTVTVLDPENMKSIIFHSL